MTDWQKLRRRVKREQNKWRDTGTNREARQMAATMEAAYNSVLWMMNDIEKRNAAA